MNMPHNFIEGLAIIGGDTSRCQYPFKKTVTRVNKALGLVTDNLVELIVEEYKLAYVVTGRVVKLKDGYRIYLPKATYRFNRYLS